MSKIRIANLLDDFALGGVTRALSIFDGAPLRDVVDSRQMEIAPGSILAPRVNSEIILTHFPPNWRRLVFLASLRLRNPGARLVHVEHSYTRAWEAHEANNRTRFRMMLRTALRIVDHVVCVSRAQAEWLSEATGLPAHRITVIHPQAQDSGLEALAPPDFSQPRPLRIGAYGRLQDIKGFDLLIDAMKHGHMPGVELIIGGYGPEEAHLRAMAHGVDSISFYGKVTELPDFFARCDVIAVPSRRESFGMVAHEAREAARPILVAPVDGLPEQVGQAGLVVDFTDPAAITQALGQLNAERLEAMSEAGRKSTLGSGEARACQWVELLSSLKN